MQYNKGEWSEAYAFLKLIGKGEVYAADENLNKIEEKKYPILKIFRDEIGKYYENKKEKGIVNVIDSEGNIISTYDSKIFITITDLALEKIKNNSGSSFKVPEIEKFLKSLGITNFKGSSKKKEDIKMKIYDLFLNRSEILTFSIKSELGNKPTILNASKSTNFLFELKGISKEKVNELNN